jgi:hypothetical protein
MSAEQGAKWLLELLEPDGSFRGATALDAYYKGPCSLAFAGYRAEAERLIDYAAQRFSLPGGDLDGTGVSWYERFRTYPHSWLLWGAVELERTEFATSLAGFLEGRVNPDTGGFRADAEGTEEIMTTSMAGLALLRFGRVDLARGAAVWLERVFHAQPDLKRGLLHTWKPGAGLTEGIDASQPRQWYFQYGISAALLADLARVTDESRWLDLARNYLHASAYCHEDRYSTPQSGKIGWGAAWAGEVALVDAVAAGLGALQGADGSWNAEGVYDAHPKADNAVARIDVTSEFVALLSLMGGKIGI